VAKILVYQFGGSRFADLPQTLTANGYEVTVCAADQNTPAVPGLDVDLILIDASNGADGKAHCEQSAQVYPDTPLVLLSTRDNPPGPHCRILTCNNILLFPFSTNELLQRLDTLLTQGQWGVLQAGELGLDVRTRRVYRAGNMVRQLTPKQARLLQLFMCYPERTLSRKFLMEAVWETDYLADTRTLDVHVRWIRECIEEDPSRPQYLRTVRGVGYRFGIPLQDRVS